MVSVEARALSVLATVDLQPATRAASGRYLRSIPVRPGVRFWATSQPRLGKDLLGVQFYGDDGRAEAERLRRRLEQAGFQARTPQTGQETFAKPAPFSADNGIDRAALRSVKRELDAILASGQSRDAGRTRSFREFMLASPLADVELDLPSRDGSWRETD